MTQTTTPWSLLSLSPLEMEDTRGGGGGGGVEISRQPMDMGCSVLYMIYKFQIDMALYMQTQWQKVQALIRLLLWALFGSALLPEKYDIGLLYVKVKDFLAV